MTSGKDFFCRARNGDEFYAVTTAFLAEDWSGELKAPDAESLDFAWTELSALPENLAASHRRILTERREVLEGPGHG